MLEDKGIMPESETPAVLPGQQTDMNMAACGHCGWTGHTYDLIATMILFMLILLFYRLNRKSVVDSESRELSSEITQFIKMKTIIAKCLVPIFVLLAFSSLGEWIYDSFFSQNHHMTSIQDVNKIFFDTCFTILIFIIINKEGEFRRQAVGCT